MTEFQRYAIYYILPPGPLAAFGAAWLGWDMEDGQPVPHPDLPDLPRPVAELTATPRKYGLHGTLKPPFRLAEGLDAAALTDAIDALAELARPVTLEALRLDQIGGFLALTPAGDTDGLATLAASVVADLDPFRAPPPQAELDRRRAAGLTARQEALLRRWGYPYVMDEFRFHITLTGNLPQDVADQTAAVLAPALAPMLPAPFVVDEVALVGERSDGFFELIHRYPLSG